VLIRRTPRLTASRNGFLARSTALSWPWNKDRILAVPGTLPPSFADLALGLTDRIRPVIQVWCKDPLQREDDAGGTAPPVALAQARAQGTAAHSGPEAEPPGSPVSKDDDQDTSQRTNGSSEHPVPLCPQSAAPAVAWGCGPTWREQPKHPALQAPCMDQRPAGTAATTVQ
jgi:hypothetical protein